MVPKKFRIPRADFGLTGYHTIKTPYFSIKAKHNGLNVNRIAVIIGKYIDKRATRRNFWKRQAKVQLLKALPSGQDFIITVYPKTTLLTKSEFAEEIKKALKRI